MRNEQSWMFGPGSCEVDVEVHAAVAAVRVGLTSSNQLRVLTVTNICTYGDISQLHTDHWDGGSVARTNVGHSFRLGLARSHNQDLHHASTKCQWQQSL